MDLRGGLTREGSAFSTLPCTLHVPCKPLLNSTWCVSFPRFRRLMHKHVCLVRQEGRTAGMSGRDGSHTVVDPTTFCFSSS